MRLEVYILRTADAKLELISRVLCERPGSPSGPAPLAGFLLRRKLD